MNTRQKKTISTADICFYITGPIFLLSLLIIKISSDEGLYFSLKLIVQLLFVWFLLPGLITVAFFGFLSGVWCICWNKDKRGIRGAFFNLLVLFAGCWYLWAFHTDLLLRMHTGESKLEYALNRNNVEMVKKELDRGKDVNFRCHFGETPLVRSIWSRNRAMFDVVLAHNPDVNVYFDNHRGRRETPLHCIVSNEFASFDNPQNNWDPLEIAQLLLEHGADPNLRAVSTYTKVHPDITPLSLAYQNEKADLVDLLLRYGADVNVKVEEHEKTLLHVAVEREDIKMVQRLLDLGATVNAKDKDTSYGVNTPLQTAARGGNVEIAKLLIENGADINIRDTEGEGGNTPLHNAVMHSDMEMIKLLIDYGADVNANRGVSNMTPLHFAVMWSKGKTDIVNYLLEHGANPNVIGLEYDHNRAARRATTPLLLAYRKKYDDIAALLIHYGAVQGDP